MHLSLIARQLADGLRRNMKNSLKVSKDLLFRKILNFFYSYEPVWEGLEKGGTAHRHPKWSSNQKPCSKILQ
jgi:hypothetical protein